MTETEIIIQQIVIPAVQNALGNYKDKKIRCQQSPWNDEVHDSVVYSISHMKKWVKIDYWFKRDNAVILMCKFDYSNNIKYNDRLLEINKDNVSLNIIEEQVSRAIQLVLSS